MERWTNREEAELQRLMQRKNDLTAKNMKPLIELVAQKLLLLANCALVKAYDEGITEGAAPNNLGRNTLIALEEAISAINDSKAVDGLILCDAKPVTRVSAIADNFGAVYVSLREPLYRTPEY